MNGRISPVPALAAAVALFGIAQLSWAQAGNWPTRPIRFIAANAPGGGLDIVARALSPS